MRERGDINVRPGRLLGAGDPAPVEIHNEAGASPFVLSCEHAGQAIPACLGSRSPPPEELQRHIAWDPGALAVARRLADHLDAVLLAQRYSRLVIDCNRPAGSPELAVRVSDGTAVPFNDGLRPAELDMRWREICQPFHQAVAKSIERRHQPIIVSVHSFVRRLRDGPERVLDLGLLSRREPSLAPALREVLEERAPSLNVRFNEPYRIEDEHDYTIPVQAEARSLLHVLLEIRNDLLRDDESVDWWALLLAGALPAAAVRCTNGGTG